LIGRPSPLGAGGSIADQVAVRRHNLSVVLTHLREAGPRSRARVADGTGLNKATVSSLVTELIDRGLVAEGQLDRGGVGRPGQSIELDGRRVCAVGAEIGVGFVAALAVNLRGDVVAQRRVVVDPAVASAAAVLERLAALVGEVLAEALPDGTAPVGLSVAVPGLVESATGTLAVAPNLGWRDVAVVGELARLLGNPEFPVVLDNEANLAAVAEVAARRSGTVDLLFVSGGTGVGGGVVSAGRLLRGGHGFAGEVGHMRVNPQGRQCTCGRRGCWETEVGLQALLSAAADPDDWVRDPAQDVDRRMDEIVRRLESRDDRCRLAVAEVGRWLGIGAGILVDVLDPDLIIFGGYYGRLGPWLREVVEAELRAAVFAPDIGGCRPEFSGLGFAGPLLGGAQSMLESVFRDPTRVPLTTAAAKSR
jgi:predicted NBD/HSP70 family sugar kinase